MGLENSLSPLRFIASDGRRALGADLSRYDIAKDGHVGGG